MKRRIFLGLAPILVLLAGIGIYAIVLLKELGGKIDLTLKENYRSVVAGRQMKESLQAMDSALVFTLLGETELGAKIYQQNQPTFAKNLVAESTTSLCQVNSNWLILSGNNSRPTKTRSNASTRPPIQIRSGSSTFRPSNLLGSRSKTPPKK